MITQSHNRRIRPAAFTLIELLVVIAIIGLLAAIIIPMAGLASKKKTFARTRAELSSYELAIENYKSKKGPYPPDNISPAGVVSPATNQLFYELNGAVLNPQTQLISSQFYPGETISVALVGTFFNSGGFANSSPDKTEIRNFMPTLQAGLIRNINTTLAPVRILVVTASGPNDIKMPGQAPFNPVNYISSKPTHNTTYDLWADVVVGGTTYRISNWSKEPEPVN